MSEEDTDDPRAFALLTFAARSTSKLLCHVSDVYDAGFDSRTTTTTIIVERGNKTRFFAVTAYSDASY
eukprot:m.1118 g.1118  ORF g.1118 m.1118 type:complete len:68 (-) comp426_c0_seq2:177-380(-)